MNMNNKKIYAAYSLSNNYIDIVTEDDFLRNPSKYIEEATTPLPLNSVRNALVKTFVKALVAEYNEIKGNGKVAAIEEIFRIYPRLFSSIWGRK